MSILNHYLQSCKDISCGQELTNATYAFLENNFPEIKICLIQHQPKPNALELLRTNCTESNDYWFNVLNESSKTRIGDGVFETNGYLFCFSSSDFFSMPVCIFIVKNQPDESVQNILNAWFTLAGILKASNQSTEKRTINNYGNLISQLFHDVQSLMELETADIKTDELSKKIEYQKKLNRSLLFYIRDFDLFKSEIGMGKFINDSLALINLNKKLNIDIQNPKLEISVDVELFAEAFNQIIQNAIEAVESDYSKVEVKIYNVPSYSPYLRNDWIVFEISDYGPGISDDFILYVTKPFFTTQKFKNLCGFGLSNAQKIIKGHNGFLEINSNNGTQVKIIIPQS